jgi:hypothetical protein
MKKELQSTIKVLSIKVCSFEKGDIGDDAIWLDPSPDNSPEHDVGAIGHNRDTSTE